MLRQDPDFIERKNRYNRYLVPRMKELLPDWGSYTEGDVGDFCVLNSYDFHKIKTIFPYTPLDQEMCNKRGDVGNFDSINGDPDIWKIGAKVFFETLLGHFEEVMMGKTTKKMILNFSHDTVVGTMLAGLGVDVVESPPFAAAIFFELWENEGSYEVRTLYNDKP